MDTKPYQKNQLYRGNYPMSKYGEIKLPDNCRWEVGKYTGNRNWFNEADDGIITLLLEEDYDGSGNGFWSVISFITKDEARALVKQLVDALSHTNI